MKQTNNFGKKGKKPCAYCKEHTNGSRMYCLGHGVAIRKWIDTEGDRAAEIWLKRNSCRIAYINKKIEQYS